MEMRGQEQLEVLSREQRQFIECAGVGSRRSEWGWLPALTVVASVGLLLVAFAYMRSRAGATGVTELFWVGLLVIYTPIAVRLAFPDISREERIGLIVALALTLYAVKLLNSPISFKNFDELLHWRTANDVIQTGKLFSYNPLLPISPYYPGLEDIVSALNKIGGLAVFPAGVAAVGMARIVFAISLYMFYRRVTGSEHWAGIATALLMANPSFLFFDAIFSYESLALPLVGLVLFAMSRWLYGGDRHRFGLVIVTAIAMGAVIVTHHISTYAMLGIVTLWALVDLIYRFFRQNEQPHVGWALALFAIVFSVIWLLRVAPRTIDYLVPEIRDAINSMSSFLSGESRARELFSTNIGTKAPLIEQIGGYAAVLLIMILLGLGLLQIWQRHRRSIPVVMLGIGAIAYPATQAFRLVHIKADVPGRTVEFIFIALAPVMALGLIGFVLPRLKLREAAKYAVVGLVSGIIFMGSAAVGWRPLPPGPRLVSDTNRSIDEQGVAAAQWARTGLGSDHRLAADRINGALMVVYGQQYQVTLSEDGIQVPNVFFAPSIGPNEAYILWEGQVEYLVVDRRLSTTLPFLGFYFEQSEPGAFHYSKPMDPGALEKFDGTENVSRVYDNGSIRIYAVRDAWNEP